MNLTKSFEFFNPQEVKGKIHIVGCGSVGSTVAEMLARHGVDNFVLYDFDVVEAHNIVNQMFVQSDVGSLKVDATERIIKDINPDATVKKYGEGYTDQVLDGYVFLAVDNIELRREVCEKNKSNHMIKVMFDFRTRLEDAQHYAAEWGDLRQVRNLIGTMNFSNEEARAATPRTACGTELGVATTVRLICAIGVVNFVTYIRTKQLRHMVVYSPFDIDTVT